MPSIDYNSNKILAPMVRVGTLPMRLLCLAYGADLVYTEETIDYKMLKCKRVVNAALDTIDFVSPDEEYPIFQTCSREKNKVVFQIGTCDSERALKVAKMVENDVAGIDVNMGCPKAFSIQGGMGAALLEQPKKIEDILTTLVQGTSVPISCKIRILPNLEDTIALVKRIEKCGVCAIAVHGRTKSERPQHANRNAVIKAISQAVTVPIIANGGSKEIRKLEDVETFRKDTAASSVMLARAPMLNPSIFRPEGTLPLDDVIDDYLKLCCQCNACPAMIKYTLQLFLRSSLHTTERGLKLQEARTLREICKIWQLDEYYCKQGNIHNDRMFRASRSITQNIQNADLEFFTLPDDVVRFPVSFERNHYTDTSSLPRTILHKYAKQRFPDDPSYITKMYGKAFVSVVNVDGRRFASSLRGKNKKHSEQSSALAAVIALGQTCHLPDLVRENLPLEEIKLLKKCT